MTPPPAATRVYPTLKAWLSEEKTQEKLAALLVDPVFVALCHYISESMKVQPEDMAGSKALLSEEIVRKTAMSVGVSQFIPSVKRLLESSITKAPLPPAWEHLHPQNQ